MRRQLPFAVLAWMACSSPEPPSAKPSEPAPSGDASATPSAIPTSTPVATPPPLDGAWARAPVVDVEGAAALGCVAQAIREHLRVTCGPVDGKAGPIDLEVEKTNAMTQSRCRAGTAFVTVPVRSDVDVVATFTWGDTSHRLVIQHADGQPAPPTPWGKFGEAFPTPPSPCKPFFMEGRGSRVNPCVPGGAAPISAKPVGELFEIDNTTEHALLGLSMVVYFYDATGNQLDEDGNPTTGKTGRSFSFSRADAVMPKRKTTKNLGKIPSPPDTRTIEAVVCSYHLAIPARAGASQADETVFFSGEHLCPDERRMSAQPPSAEPGR